MEASEEKKWGRNLDKTHAAFARLSTCALNSKRERATRRNEKCNKNR
jgi:hypothetical protein